MEKNKIYIPVNIQTEQMIFQGYGMKELGKTLTFAAVLCVFWGVLYLFTHSTIQFLFEAIVSVAIGVVIFVKDNTNQCVVDYIKYMLRFACSQRIYKYDNEIEREEQYIVREYQEIIRSE
ncbi:MAG: hypothetical protein HFE51_10680 [Clostridia bacterium]|nr:hypothetical protein [Clostridia bacterium]